MKIAFDYPIFGWQKRGGVSRCIYKLAVESAISHARNVAGLSPMNVNRYPASAPKKLNVMGIPAPALPKAGRIYCQYARAWALSGNLPLPERKEIAPALLKINIKAFFVQFFVLLKRVF